MAYDPVAHAVLMFGGQGLTNGAFTRYADTWLWDGKAWKKPVTAVAPRARQLPALISDPVHGQVVMTGGKTATDTGFDDNQDTWIWANCRWQEAHPVHQPQLAWVRGAFDTAGGYPLILGASLSTHQAETWKWDGTDWVRLYPTQQPPALIGPAMGTDPATGHVVMFGGLLPNDHSLANQTWQWDGSSWQPVPSAVTPRPRFSGFLLPTASGHLLQRGGSELTRAITDAWLYQAGQWSPVTVKQPAVADTGAAAAWDPDRRVVVIYGGNSLADDVFEDSNDPLPGPSPSPS